MKFAKCNGWPTDLTGRKEDKMSRLEELNKIKTDVLKGINTNLFTNKEKAIDFFTMVIKEIEIEKEAEQ